MLLIYCTIFVFILYLILLIIFINGWKLIPVFIDKIDEPLTQSISIVIACKNEERNLPSLISALINQNYKNFELIFVNDHSTDNTNMLLIRALLIFKNIQIVDAVGFGKKNAIKEGIFQASGELIVTTDADCIPNSRWIETILQFQTRYPSDLIICPVKLSSNNTMFSKLQEIEFVSLVASGAGAAGVGKPIMCNGANMAFTKNAWLKNQSDLHNEEQSGDDIFLLQSIKRMGGVIRFLKSQNGFVTTQSSQTIRDFFKQRRRWASKAPKYNDWETIITACIVVSINLLSLILLLNSFYNVLFLNVFIAVCIFKYLLDSMFIITVKNFFGLKNVLKYSLFLSAIYPFYTLLVGLSVLMLKPKTWK